MLCCENVYLLNKKCICHAETEMLMIFMPSLYVEHQFCGTACSILQ